MAMIKCLECGAEISSLAKICPKCGAPVEKRTICEDCGTEILESMETCPKCGCPNPNFFQNHNNIANNTFSSIKKTKKSTPQKILSIISLIIGILMIFLSIVICVDYINYKEPTDALMAGYFFVNGLLFILTWKPSIYINLLSTASILSYLLLHMITFHKGLSTTSHLSEPTLAEYITIITFSIIPIVSLVLSKYKKIQNK